MRRRRLAAGVLLLAAGASACVRTVELSREEVTPTLGDEVELGSAGNLPPAFRPLVPAAVEGDCPARLGDPVLQTRLYLVRALAVPVADSLGSRLHALGDYRVEPPGHYGLLPGDGLRIECGRLRAIGAIRLP